MIEQQQISLFSGMPGPRHFRDLGSSPAPQDTILKRISAQLRTASLSFEVLSGAKHSPSSSCVQVVLRTQIQDFREIWVNSISNVFRKIFKCGG